MPSGRLWLLSDADWMRGGGAMRAPVVAVPGSIPWDDFSDLVGEDYRPIQPGVVFRDDGVGLLYEGMLNAFIGETESGKTTAALYSAKVHLEHAGAVFYFDWEMDRTQVWDSMQKIGVSEASLAGWRYVNWAEDVEARIDQIVRVAESGKDVLVVVDSVDEFLLSIGVDPNSQEAGSRLSMVFGKPLKPAGVTVLFIDHVSSSVQGVNKRGAAGSFRKLANADAAMKFVTKRVPRPGGEGKIELRINKDRPGTLRANSPVNASGSNKEQTFGVLYLDSRVDPSHIEVRITRSGASEAPKAGKDATLVVLYRADAFDFERGVTRRTVQETLERNAEANNIPKPGANSAKNTLSLVKRDGFVGADSGRYWLTDDGKKAAAAAAGSEEPT